MIDYSGRVRLVICDKLDGVTVLGGVANPIEPQFLEELDGEGGGSFKVDLGVTGPFSKRNVVHNFIGDIYAGSWLIDKPAADFVNDDQQKFKMISGPGLRQWAEDAITFPAKTLVPQSYSVDASTDIFTSTAHGLIAQQKIVFNAGAPTGLLVGVPYYVLAPATNTFKVTATIGGTTAVDVTANGSATFSLGIIDTDTPKQRYFNFATLPAEDPAHPGTYFSSPKTWYNPSDWHSVVVMSRQDAQSALTKIIVASGTVPGDLSLAPATAPDSKTRRDGGFKAPGYQLYGTVNSPSTWVWDGRGFYMPITDVTTAPATLAGLTRYPVLLDPGYAAYATLDPITGAWSNASTLVYWNSYHGNDIQTFTQIGGTGTINFSMTIGSETTTALSTASSAATIQAAIEALNAFNPGDVTVAGSASPMSMTITYTGRYENAFCPRIFLNILPVYPPPTVATGGINVAGTGSFTIVSGSSSAVGQPAPPNWTDVNPWRSLPPDWPTATAEHARWVWSEDVRSTQNAVQTLTETGAGLTSFTITFNGQTTGSISATATAAAVTASLVALNNIAPGDITVTDQTVIGPPRGPLSMIVQFAGAYATGVVPVMTTLPIGGTGKVNVFATSFKSGLAQGDVYFRKTFTIANLDGTKFSLFVTADDGFTAYVDGRPVLDSNAPSSFFQTFRADLVLTPGDHVIGVKVTNTSIGGGLLCALVKLGNDAGVPATAFLVSDSTWTYNARPVNPPGYGAGEILLKLLAEATARGVTSLARLVPTFTAEKDSSGPNKLVPDGTGGASWTPLLEWSFDVGRTFREVIEQLEELVCDVNIKWNPGDTTVIPNIPPRYELNAYVKQGKDRTGAIGANGSVQLIVGHSVTQAGEDQESFAAKSDLLVNYTDGWLQIQPDVYDPLIPANAPTHPKPYGRIEGFLSVQGTQQFAYKLAQKTIEQTALALDSATIAFIPETGVVPWQNFQLGDLIVGPMSDGTVANRRVHSISFTQDPANANDVTYAVEFDTIAKSRLQAIQRGISTLSDGGLIGTVANSSIPPPPAEALGVAPDTTAGLSGDDALAGYGTGSNVSSADAGKIYFDAQGNLNASGSAHFAGDVIADGAIIGASAKIGGVSIEKDSGNFYAPNIYYSYANGEPYNTIGQTYVNSNSFPAITLDVTNCSGKVIEIQGSAAVVITLPKLTPAPPQPYSYIFEVYLVSTSTVQFIADPSSPPTLVTPSGLFMRTRYTTAILRYAWDQVWHIGGSVSV